MGIDEFAKDTLIAAKKIDIAVNLMSLFRGSDMKVYAVIMDSPRIHAIVNKEGKTNWDIAKADTLSSDTATEAEPFNLELQHYAINNGYLSYIDQKTNLNGEIKNFNHEGSGDFTSDLFTLETSTRAEATNFTYGNIPYLVNAETNIDADIEVNNQTNTYQFKTDKIQVNNLRLTTEGMFQLVNDGTYKMDISFKAPSTDLKDILSLIPTIYKNDFNKVKTSGNAIFSGFVKGTYSGKQLPAYNINLDIKNGLFQYSDLPRPIKNINLTLKVDNPDGISDHTVMTIPQGHMEMENEPFDFRLLLKNPVSDMFIDAAAKGKLDLTKITQFIKLGTGTRLSGLISADVSAKGSIAAAEAQQYERFRAAGTIAVSSFQYASADYPDGVKINNLFMTFNPRDIMISDLDGQYKKTNFSANGTINNLFPYVFRDKSLSANLKLKADQMNLNDWMGATTDTTSQTAKPTAPFAVPANLNFLVNASIGRLLYDKLEIQNVSGNVVIQDESVRLNNIEGNALAGSMLINGSYSTKVNKKKPDISIGYDVKGFDVQKTFYAFNTVQKLMPVGQYLSGKLSSQLKMTGKLGDNMEPDLRSLTGEGSILLIEGFLKKFAPLEKLANLLNVNELKELTMKEVRNHIEFTNGKVLVKPFTVKVKDIEMEIGGMHGFDQSLDYLLNLKLPRALMGDKGNSFVNNLVTQVNNKGIPFRLGETVNLHIDLGGTIKSPTFKIDLKETASDMAEQLKQQALAFAKSKIDSARQIFKDTALVVGKELEKDLEEELRKRVFGSKDTVQVNRSGVDTSKKRMEETRKAAIKDLLKPKKKTDTSRTKPGK